jgi:hypothetical protein
METVAALNFYAFLLLTAAVSAGFTDVGRQLAARILALPGVFSETLALGLFVFLGLVFFANWRARGLNRKLPRLCTVPSAPSMLPRPLLLQVRHDGHVRALRKDGRKAEENQNVDVIPDLSNPKVRSKPKSKLKPVRGKGSPLTHREPVRVSETKTAPKQPSGLHRSGVIANEEAKETDLRAKAMAARAGGSFFLKGRDHSAEAKARQRFSAQKTRPADSLDEKRLHHDLQESSMVSNSLDDNDAAPTNLLVVPGVAKPEKPKEKPPKAVPVGPKIREIVDDDYEAKWRRNTLRKGAPPPPPPPPPRAPIETVRRWDDALPQNKQTAGSPYPRARTEDYSKLKVADKRGTDTLVRWTVVGSGGLPEEHKKPGTTGTTKPVKVAKMKKVKEKPGEPNKAAGFLKKGPVKLGVDQSSQPLLDPRHPEEERKVSNNRTDTSGSRGEGSKLTAPIRLMGRHPNQDSNELISQGEAALKATDLTPTSNGRKHRGSLEVGRRLPSSLQETGGMTGLCLLEQRVERGGGRRKLLKDTRQRYKRRKQHLPGTAEGSLTTPVRPEKAGETLTLLVLVRSINIPLHSLAGTGRRVKPRDRVLKAQAKRKETNVLNALNILTLGNTSPPPPLAGPRPVYRYYEPTPRPKPHVNPFRDASYTNPAEKPAPPKIQRATQERLTLAQMASSKESSEDKLEKYKMNLKNLEKNGAKGKKLYTQQETNRRAQRE